jgi:hypothetical protein
LRGVSERVRVQVPSIAPEKAWNPNGFRAFLFSEKADCSVLIWILTQYNSNEKAGVISTYS